MSVAFADPITQPQRKFLDSLVRDRAVTDDHVRTYALVSTKKEASQLIAEFKALPFKTAKFETKPGFYVQNGTVFKVVMSENGRPYAKKQVSTTDSKGKPKGVWVYAPGEVKNFEDLTPLTASEAGVISLKVGYCCICGRTLTAKESVSKGVGPICAGKAF